MFHGRRCGHVVASPQRSESGSGPVELVVLRRGSGRCQKSGSRRIAVVLQLMVLRQLLLFMKRHEVSVQLLQRRSRVVLLFFLLDVRSKGHGVFGLLHVGKGFISELILMHGLLLLLEELLLQRLLLLLLLLRLESEQIQMIPRIALILLLL